MGEEFGLLPNGELVRRANIRNDTISLSVLTYGATMQSIELKDVPFSLCLGFETLEQYLSSTACVGAIVGRVANRIGGGRAVIDGIPQIFDRNESNLHTLHGGSGNLASKNWSLVSHTSDAVRLQTQLKDGENGFPGTMEITADYILRAGNTLEIVLEAKTDASTLCNLAPHPYFNLNGSGDAREQSLFVNADVLTEANADKIPTGALLPVDDTPWDHRTERQISESGAAYDHNYCVGKERTTLRPVARLKGMVSGATMQIATTEPGLQVYDGGGLHPPYAGIALEPQCWPDAPNHETFPSILLRPGETSRQVTQLTFSKS